MNFSKHIDRNEFATLKWSKAFLAEHFGNEDAIPMSVADMDFEAPPSVTEKLQNVRHMEFSDTNISPRAISWHLSHGT